MQNIKQNKNHQQKVERIVDQLKSHDPNKPISLKKKAVSHVVPNPKSKVFTDEKIDISDLNDILLIDKAKKICVAESGVTFVKLVEETMKHNLVPIIVPELKTITIGGAVSGCSIESMSYKFGGFHDTCLEYEIITANGDVLICTPDNENKLLFQMAHGTFGTLGIISKLKFRLIPAKKFVKVDYQLCSTVAEYKEAIWKHFQEKDVDFMDGIIHSPDKLVLSTANFIEKAPYTNSYEWMKVYYKSTLKRKEDYLKTADYFFRYDKGVTNVNPKSFLGRLLLGRFVSSTQVLRLAEKFHKFIPASRIPVTLDMFIPFSRWDEFMIWYQKEVNFFPLWCVPYKRVRDYEWINQEFLEKNPDDMLFIDIAIYGLRKKKDKDYHRILEDKLMEIGALKTLISTNLYSEKDFWKIWNKKKYQIVKVKTDPNNIFRDLYDKMCRATQGLNNK